MADQSQSPAGRTAGHRLDGATREQLLALLQEELARASREALASGTSPEALAATLEERIARLRAQLSGRSAQDAPPAD